MGKTVYPVACTATNCGDKRSRGANSLKPRRERAICFAHGERLVIVCSEPQLEIWTGYDIVDVCACIRIGTRHRDVGQSAQMLERSSWCAFCCRADECNILGCMIY